jgi:hypothetical protein
MIGKGDITAQVGKTLKAQEAGLMFVCLALSLQPPDWLKPHYDKGLVLSGTHTPHEYQSLVYARFAYTPDPSHINRKGIGGNRPIYPRD